MKIDLTKAAVAIKTRAGSMLCLLVCAFLITGCVTAEEKNRMQWDINSLRDEVKEIKQKSSSIESEFPDRQKQIDEQLSELEEMQRAAAKTVSDLLMRIQYLTTEVQMLTGRFEESRYSSEKNSAELQESKEMLIAKMKQIETEVGDLKKRLTEAAAAVPPKEAPKKAAPEVKKEEPKPLEEPEEEAAESKPAEVKAVAKDEPAAEDKDAAAVEEAEAGKAEDAPAAEVKEEEVAQPEGKTEVKDAYLAAYEAYKEERTVEAREMFKALLDEYEENEYSDNARFWIAESYYRDANYEDAILAYEELFKKNPDSDKVPGALLKQGLAFYALKDKKTGKIILERLIDRFPDSDQAKLAERKINKTVPPKKK